MGYYPEYYAGYIVLADRYIYTAFARGSELTTEVLREELGATRPLSVTRREEVLALQRWAEGRTVPAS